MERIFEDVWSWKVRSMHANECDGLCHDLMLYVVNVHDLVDVDHLLPLAS